jgi:hypothetical protein
MQGHPDVAHVDLHRGLGVLVFEEEEDSALAAALGRLGDAVDQPGPALLVGSLERVVVALDARPDDEVRAELSREVDGRQRAAHGLPARLLVRRDQTASPEARIQVQAGCHAVDVVAGERVADFLEVVLVQLLRIVELVPVDQVAEASHRPTDSLGCRLGRELRFVATGDEARDHRAQRPDAETGLHLSLLSCGRTIQSRVGGLDK